MRRRSLFAVVGCLLAACDTNPGVRADRADVVVTSPEATAPEVTDPVATDPETTTPSTPPESPSPDGIGDELFPALGNPGVDVQHYDITLTYDPSVDRIDGTVGLDLVVTEARPQITLDAVGLDVASVAVDGVAAEFEVDDPELRITLPVAEPAGGAVRVEVSYSVDTTPTTSSVGLPNGWFNTPDGSYVLNEPDGARSWLPSNDHPSDKASYTFTITVPEGVTAVANGVMVSHTTDAAGDTWVWQQDDPMTTYLIQLITGDYELIEGSGPGGLPLVSAVLRDDVELMQPFLDVTADQIAFFEDYFGPYPLDAYGIAITDSFGGLAMETQGRSLFSREDFLSGGLGYIEQLLLSHELTHQWFGDAVSPARWKDIWLNESFATYGQWMWFDHVGMGPLAQTAEFTLSSRPPGATGDPSAEELFGFNSYDGGAVVLHALRLTMGDEPFFRLLQRWVAENNGASRVTQDFIALAEDVAGRDLTAFFDDWLFSVSPPTEFPPAQ